MTADSKNYSKSANRALDVLDYLAHVRKPARASEIADALDIARSSANQLLKSMVTSGYLLFSVEGKSYFPSYRTARFGHWIAGCYPDMARLSAMIGDVHAKTGETVTLAMENDCFVQLMEVAKNEDHHPLLEVGAKLPVVGTANGSALLTTKSPRAINRLVERARRQRANAQSGLSAVPFLDQIRLFRMKGYAWRPMSRVICTDDKCEPVDYYSIAMPLPRQPGMPEVIMSIAGPARRVRAGEWNLVNLMRRSIQSNLVN